MATRSGISPVKRPTEWTTAVAMLVSAGILFYNDRDTAALVATASACLPVIITAIVAAYERRKAQREQ